MELLLTLLAMINILSVPESAAENYSAQTPSVEQQCQLPWE
jgi:hypothetical protein